MRLIAIALVPLVLAACGPTAEPSPEAPEGQAAAEAPPPVERTVTEVTPITAAGLVDEIAEGDHDAVVVNVWATWCGPCRIEFPEFVRYQREAAAGDVEAGRVAVRFLSIDEPADYERALDFIAEQGAAGPAYVSADGTPDIVAALAPLWTGGIPITFVFDGEGIVRDYWEGTANYEMLADRVGRVASGETATQG